MSRTIEIALEMTIRLKSFATRNAATRVFLVLQTCFVGTRVDAIKKSFGTVTAYLAQGIKTLITWKYFSAFATLSTKIAAFFFERRCNFGFGGLGDEVRRGMRYK